MIRATQPGRQRCPPGLGRPQRHGAAAATTWTRPGAPALDDADAPAPAAPLDALRSATPSATIGGIVLIAYILLAVIGPSITPYSPLEFNYSDTLQATLQHLPGWAPTSSAGISLSRVLAGAAASS